MASPPPLHSDHMSIAVGGVSHSERTDYPKPDRQGGVGHALQHHGDGWPGVARLRSRTSVASRVTRSRSVAPPSSRRRTSTERPASSLQDIDEDGVPLKLDHLADVSFPVTSEELTLSIDDFSTRLLTPAMEAIVQKVDAALAEAAVDAAEGPGGGGTATMDTKASDVMIEAREKLTDQQAPGHRSLRRAVAAGHQQGAQRSAVRGS